MLDIDKDEDYAFSLFVKGWSNKTADDEPRENLGRSDQLWEYTYSKREDLRFTEGELLFRVHSGGYEEPVLSNVNEIESFNERHQLWSDQLDSEKIRFDNHWVSFTKNPKALCRNYFAMKGLHGLVIIIKARKAIDIAAYAVKGEEEVVAPRSKESLVEILTFEKFKKKYVPIAE